MTDTKELQRLLEDCGLRKSYISQQLGISLQAFRLKILGRYDFRQAEIAKLQYLLRLSNEDVIRIFFAKDVD